MSTFYISGSLLFIIIFTITLISLNSQKDKLVDQNKDTGSLDTSILIMKIFLIISIVAFGFSIYYVNREENKFINSLIQNVGEGTSILKRAANLISQKIADENVLKNTNLHYTPASDKWFFNNIKNLIGHNKEE